MPDAPSSAASAVSPAVLHAQKMEALGQLAGGIAHDFNNLLTVITGYSQLLLDRDDVPDAFVQPLRHVFTAGSRASDLTRQLLLFGRNRPIERRPVDLNEVVTDVTAMLARLLGERIELQVALTPAPLVVDADVALLEQVLVNLAVNARDAMPHGGKLIVANRRLTLPGPGAAATAPDGRAGDFACLGVSDTGDGIAPEHLGRIFEPFYTTKEPGQGTGLGLATAQSVVRQHDGWIDVESAPTRGTTFRVFLPLSARSLVREVTSAQRSGAAGRPSETILLVEDDSSVREFAVAVLRSGGFRVLQAANGAEALEVWQWHQARIGVLFTDLVIPHCTSGVALAEQLRREKPSLKVVVTTGYGADTGAPIAYPPGTRVVPKPYKPDMLLQTLRAALDENSD